MKRGLKDFEINCMLEMSRNNSMKRGLKVDVRASFGILTTGGLDEKRIESEIVR